MNRFRLILSTLLVTGLIGAVMAQDLAVGRVNPTNWYVGMKNPALQLLIHGTNLADAKVSTTYPGVTIEKVHTVENPNYLFVDLRLAPTTKPGTVPLVLTKTFPVTGRRRNETVVTGGNAVTRTISYELKARTAQPQTVDARDFVYLLMPDRFANADPTNDKFADLADTQADRSSPWLRHGGDLLGVERHLDYIKELGATTIWLNPVIENNQPLTNEGGSQRSAYHGYGFTDHYTVDKRLGGNEAYRRLIDAAHAKGLKIMQDAVYNHVGQNHWFVRDLPMKDWLNQWPEGYQNTSYKDQPLVDPYAAKIDRRIARDGWFVPFLPDLNHQNPYVANFLIQHALWTVEYFNIDSWRVDTYFYNDLDVMNRLNAALLAEHPNLFITGESWVNSVINQAYFVRNKLQVPTKSNLPSAIDFQLYFALNDAMNQNPGWNQGVDRLYQTLAQDVVYEDAFKNLLFVDNHDLDRYYSVIGEDFAKYKMGLTWLLTTRGVPSLYYGTEILMKNFKNPSDAEVRKDFPGGFPGDAVNKFTAAGRTAQEAEAFNFVKTLATYRRDNPVLHTGQLTQFLPENGVYVYFRHNADKTVLVVMNANANPVPLKTARFAERMQGYRTARNVVSGETLSDLGTLNVPAKTAWVLELGR
jgi:glycosidase